jgi:hypothetical protein
MLMFREPLARQVMDGTKTQTRRKLSDNPNSPWWRERCAHEAGSRHAVCPGRGVNGIGFVVLDDVTVVRLGHITHDGAIAEGFADVRAFMQAWEQINGTWDPRERVWLLRFHVETAAELAGAR